MHATSPNRHPVSCLSALLVLLAFALAGCGDDGAGPGETVSLSPGTVSLFVGETQSLTATVSGSSNGSVTFSSSNDQVATVTQAGLVTAVGLGSATVTAATPGGQASATAAVTVNPSSVTAAPAAVELDVGETAQLTATVQGGVGLNVSWSSANETVATVGDDGEVMGEGVGVTTVTASIDGQPGVQADVEVTVSEAAPDLILEGITTLDGSAIDPGSVSGVIVFDFTVSGPAGLTGEVDVLFGDLVVATAPVSLSAAASGLLVAAGPLAGAEKRLGLAVATFSAERIEDVGQMKFPAGLIEATARLRLGSGTIPARIRGSEGSTTSLTITPQMVAIVEALDEPEPVTGTDGNLWTSGGLSFRGWLVHHEGVTPPTEVTLGLDLYGSPYEVSALVTDRTFHVELSDLDAFPSGLGGFAGPVELVGIEDQNQNALSLANLYPPDSEYLDGWEEISARYWKDNLGPVYDGPPFEVPAPYWIGDGVDLTEHFQLRASYDPDAWQDPGVGLDECEWRAGFQPGIYPIGGSTSGDWPQTSDYELYVAKTCKDLLGAETALALNHPVGVDLVTPEVGWTAGSTYISDFSVNPFADAVVKPTGFDPIPDGLTGSSGMDPLRWDLSLSYASPMSTPESGCISGLFQDGMCQKLPVPSPWSDGFLPDRSAGAGEYRAHYSLYDFAGNFSQSTVRWIDDTTPPVVGDITYDPDSFVLGSIEFSANVTDNLELWRANIALRYGDLGYAFLGESALAGTPYDGTFVNSAQVVTTYSSFFEAVQTTSSSPPHGPTGTWYKATGALFGAQDTGGNVGANYAPLDHLTSAPTGTQTAVDGTYLVPGPVTLGVPDGGTCTVPTKGLYGAEFLIPGNAATGPDLNIDAARLFAVERLAVAGSTENVAYSVSPWLTPEVFDFGSYRAAYVEFEVNPSLGPMPEGETEFFWQWRLPDNLRLQSQGFTVEVRYCQ